MATDYGQAAATARKPASIRTVLLIALLAFVAGLLAAVWTLSEWDDARALLPAPEPTPVLATPRVIAPAPATVLAPEPPIEDVRVAELEDRIDRVSERARAAAGNAARAEGLLVAFAARRALDRRAGLGYIEAQLKERFGATQPRAVATIIAASREPITLEELRLGLEDLSPALTGGRPEEGWWPAFRRELGRLVVVRRAGTASTTPDDRLRVARRMLEGGQVDAALAEVARLPGRERAENWMSAARRYIEARRALDVIETAALLTPIEPVAPISAGQQSQPLP